MDLLMMKLAVYSLNNINLISQIRIHNGLCKQIRPVCLLYVNSSTTELKLIDTQYDTWYICNHFRAVYW